LWGAKSGTSVKAIRMGVAGDLRIKPGEIAVKHDRRGRRQ
jgi:hypothetical protein